MNSLSNVCILGDVFKGTLYFFGKYAGFAAPLELDIGFLLFWNPFG